MTIFRLNFLLKVGQMKVCQNPSFISTIVRFAGLQGVLSILNFCNSEHLYIVSWAMHVRVVYMDNGPRTP